MGQKIQPVEILLVEDNEDDVILLKESMKDEGLLNVVHVVQDGEEALAYLRREGPFSDATRPGLVLLDINMPRKNGFEVLKELKEDNALRAIPVIMLTTSSRDEDIVRSYSDGACSFITKPVLFDDLRRVVQQFSLYWSLVSRIPPH
jgi:CheY-like chemotaxis protein